MKEYIEQAMTFAEYIKLIDDLLLEDKTTGENQSEMMVGFGKLNRQRMLRLEKTVELNDGVKTAAQNLKRKMVWLILTEGWCGDAAQNVPIIEKIAAESVNIKTRYILRDENLGLMDQYLTEGGRAIPKLIALDEETLEVLGTWGSRPAAAQALLHEMKFEGLEKTVMMEKMQRWYLADKNQSIQAEFEVILEQWDKASASAAAK